MGLALIVSAGSNANEYLARHAAELGYTRPVIVASCGEARRQLTEKSFEILLINAPLPDEFGHELAVDAVGKTNAGVVLLVKAGTAEQISGKLQDYGVLVLGKPFSSVQFLQTVQLAASCFRRLAILQEENDRLQEKITQIRLVDRAKCALIEKRGMTEADAHRLIEKRAMDSRRARGAVAEELLEEIEEL